MVKQFFWVFIVATILNVLPAAAQDDGITELRRDRSTPQQVFSSGEVSGWVRYRRLYRAREAQPLTVYIRLQASAPLYCMEGIDFSYDLQSADGEHITAQVRPGFGQAIVPQPRIWRYRNGHWVCPYLPRFDATFPLAINQIFPNLRPGGYTLQITFRPLDGSVPNTTLPSVTFRVV